MLENIIILYPTKDICSIKNMLHAVLCVRKWVLIYHAFCKRWYMVLWKKYFQNTILLSLHVSLWENRWGPEEITGNALLSPSTLCPLDRICKQPWNSLLFFRLVGLWVPESSLTPACHTWITGTYFFVSFFMWVSGLKSGLHVCVESILTHWTFGSVNNTYVFW